MYAIISQNRTSFCFIISFKKSVHPSHFINLIPPPSNSPKNSLHYQTKSTTLLKPLFQNTVLQKYLQTADQTKISAAYDRFKAHFHNPEIQENIRTSKEEQYQGEFMIDLFVTVLGYVKNPQPGFNLTKEYKNVKNSKKAGAATIINNVVKGIIEQNYLIGFRTNPYQKLKTI